jgi:MATE family multidrug resistance protein
VLQLAKKQGINLAVKAWLSVAKIGELLNLNRDIFIRSLALQLCFSFMTFYGARIGETTLAANAVLLNFLMLVSFALDGIAYASEAKVGKAKGEQSVEQIKLWVNLSLFWGGLFALFYSLIFLVFGGAIIRLLTDVPEVVSMATHYLPWVIILPIAAMGCFLFDGVFVGLTRAKDMRNTMLISATFGFFGLFWLVSDWQNHGLWFAMTSFMLLRGITLWLRYRAMVKQQQLLI